MSVWHPRGIAASHSWDLVRMMQDRYVRSTAGHEKWAKDAKENFDFVEGDQWPQEVLEEMRRSNRPALTFNEIRPLVFLVAGFFAQNRSALKIVPQDLAESSEATAEAATHLMKMIDERNKMEFLDSETFFNGMVGGRAYQDTRISFDDNDQGEIIVTNKDPFSVFLDPDAEHYDLNKGNFVISSRMVSLEEAEIMFGRDLAFTLSSAMGARFGPVSVSERFVRENEVAPWRGFSGGFANFDALRFSDSLEEHFDKVRKTVRLLDMQHYVRVRRKHFIDLETGDKIAIPEQWDQKKIDAVAAWHEEQGRPVQIQRRIDRRVRWTIMCGDIIVYDEWSPYERFTLDAFFPYFRGGRTRGMVSDLKDPQIEKNKRRSAEIDIVSRTANSGWMYPEGALDPDQEANLEQFGAMPGVIIKYKDPDLKPEQIKPQPPATAMERLERRAETDLRRISGINESALGEVDTVQSGKAIENRQRQSIIGVQPYLDNFTRFKVLSGENRLSQIQRWYTERRLVRLRGINGTGDVLTEINAPSPEGRIINDVTMGRYSVNIDTEPAERSFMESQFREILDMAREKLIPPEAADLIIDLSSIPNKDEFKKRIEMLLQAQGIPIGQEGGMPMPMGGGAPAPAPAGGNQPQELSTDLIQQILSKGAANAA